MVITNEVSRAAPRRSVGICDGQPVVSAGVAAMLAAVPEFAVAGTACSLGEAHLVFAGKWPDLLLLDHGFGVPQLIAWMSSQGKTANLASRFVVWGAGLRTADVFLLLRNGADGVLDKSADAHTIRECLRAVAEGGRWNLDGPLPASRRLPGSDARELTGREQQVCELAERGLRNQEIAQVLGISVGTVKIHLRHIFEKVGVRSRYGLALAALRSDQPPAP